MKAYRIVKADRLARRAMKNRLVKAGKLVPEARQERHGSMADSGSEKRGGGS